MSAIRLFDLFNCKIGSTQIVGADTFGADWGYRMLAANNDGHVVQAARDRAAFFANARLGGQDPGGFATLLALFEAADSLSIHAEGKVAGDVSKSQKVEFKHAKLASASLSFRPGQYAATTFDFRNSAAVASSSSDDEVAITEIAEKTITHAAGLRGGRIKSAVFTPSAGDAVTPLAITGLDLNLRGQIDQTAGDDDFGEVAEIAGYELSGSIDYKDETITAGATVAQQLTDTVYGSIAVTYTQQAGAADKVLTINNVYFESGRGDLNARKYHSNRLAFGCFAQVGSDFYTIATGATKLIAVA